MILIEDGTLEADLNIKGRISIFNVMKINARAKKNLSGVNTLSAISANMNMENRGNRQIHFQGLTMDKSTVARTMDISTATSIQYIIFGQFLIFLRIIH